MTAAIKLAPSVLAANFARLGEQVREVEQAGADRIHVDVMDGHFVPNISMGPVVVQALGKQAGVVLNPATSPIAIAEILSDADLVLVMTVNPGFGGQKFIPSTINKIRRVRQMIDHTRPDIELEVDGGIDAQTAPQAVEAGARVLVAGSAIFGAADGATAAMKRLCDALPS